MATMHIVEDNAIRGLDIIVGTDIIESPSLAMIRTQGVTKLIRDEDLQAQFLEGFNLDRPESIVKLGATKTTTIEPWQVNIVQLTTGNQRDNGFISGLSEPRGQVYQIEDGLTEGPVSNHSSDALKIKESQILIRGTFMDPESTKVGDEEQLLQTVSEVARSDEVDAVEREPITADMINVGPHATEEERQQICKLLNKYRSCVALKLMELGCIRMVPMGITEEPGSQPVSSVPYRASFKEREILREIIKELKSQGVVRDSYLNYSSPILLVLKKNGDSRMVVNYKKLNKQTIKDNYPMPRIDDMLDGLYSMVLFCILDAFQGFHQVPLDDASTRKAAFCTPDGLFEPTRLFFRLINGPAVFQRSMVCTLEELIWAFVACFIDDIFFGGRNIQHLMERLEQVLRKLQKDNVTLRLLKCGFALEKVEY